MGRVYQPTRQCLVCQGAGCERCGNTGRRQIETWCIQFSFRNRQYRESSGSTRRADAVKLLKKRMAEVGAGKRVVSLAAERTTFENLMAILRDDYHVNGRKSARRMGTSIDRLAEVFSGSRAVDITTERIRTYMRQRLDAGKAHSTVRNEINALRRAFRLAHESGKVAEVPHFPKLEVNNTRTGFFEEAEFRKVLEHLPAPVAAIAEFGYLSGWRLGEILPLRWLQVDREAGVIRLEVGSTKNNDGRVLPFSVLPALRQVIERQLAYTREVEQRKSLIVPWVFHRNGREIRNLDTAWKIACEKAGCPGRIFHDLRRTAVRNLERAGVSRSIAMKITGHRTEAIYRRYAIVNEADMAEGLGKLAGYLDRRAGPGGR
jgi:integrase